MPAPDLISVSTLARLIGGAACPLVIAGEDHRQLEAGIAVYDALYRWARDAREEKHDWTSHQPRGVRA
ncbi:hypothetical protein [Sphingomonas koreensis]|jgi:hypothetical protein|uniref:Uncharacterized protein n=1 Tax=Sphingomonas koreensis TaxID=93064 RepID=A0A1L6JB78_9SPHN|nr:hypothetical protein BRX40_10290 [Sphingomonas koreensis]